MADYWLTYRIDRETIGGRTYDDRRDALIEVIDKTSEGWWIEPTSFMAFDSGKRIDVLATEIRDAIEPTHDLVLLHRIGYKTARVIGEVEYPDSLLGFFDYVLSV